MQSPDLTSPEQIQLPEEEPVKRTNTRGKMLCLLGLLASAAALSTPLLTRISYVFDVFSHFTLHYFSLSAYSLRNLAIFGAITTWQ